MVSMIPLFGGLPVGPELLIILLVLVLLFGANKIPKLARSTGQAMGEFKKGRTEVEEELREMTEGEPVKPDDTDSNADSAVDTNTEDEPTIEDAESDAETETDPETETEPAEATEESN
ncbi:MAG: Sec-independent protein translocase subunit TatA/TatB [Halobacteriota archaeon]